MHGSECELSQAAREVSGVAGESAGVRENQFLDSWAHIVSALLDLPYHLCAPDALALAKTPYPPATVTPSTSARAASAHPC